jgi:hypothetical protein
VYMTKTVKRTTRNKRMKKTNKKRGGGPLAFEGYFFSGKYHQWNPSDWKDCKSRLSLRPWWNKKKHYDFNPFTENGDKKYYNKTRKTNGGIDIGVESIGHNQIISDDEMNKADVCYKMFKFKNEYIKKKRKDDSNYKYTSSEDVLREAVDAQTEEIKKNKEENKKEEKKEEKKEKEGEEENKEEENKEGEEEEGEEEEGEGYLDLWYSGGRKRKTLKSRKNKRTGRKLKRKTAAR